MKKLIVGLMIFFYITQINVIFADEAFIKKCIEERYQNEKNEYLREISTAQKNVILAKRYAWKANCNFQVTQAQIGWRRFKGISGGAWLGIIFSALSKKPLRAFMTGPAFGLVYSEGTTIYYKSSADPIGKAPDGMPKDIFRQLKDEEARSNYYYTQDNLLSLCREYNRTCKNYKWFLDREPWVKKRIRESVEREISKN